MKVNYQYASPSMCIAKDGETVLGLSPDLSRDEKVSFSGRLKNPLVFRDAMLMLREIVISDATQKKKERVEFYQWLEGEIERKILEHQEYMPDVRDKLTNDIDNTNIELQKKLAEIDTLNELKAKIKKAIDNTDVWKDYYKIERDFWKFIHSRDLDLWFVLDPVITVHPDQVSFEAFSVDESIYGCLSIDISEFEMLQEPKLGTTNIDFSAKLAKEMERFRTYNKVELTVNPGGFSVDSGTMPEHIEKKIDLPETWIKGFNQVSAAASLGGLDIDLSPVDMYDICSFLRRHKENKSPRYMKWIFEPNQPIQIVFEPFGKTLTLTTIYKGEKRREEKIWGRRRWLVLEKIIPLSSKFTLRLLGFGMPQFIIADMGTMKLTIGFSSWSSNDWVKGTAFNIMAGFIGNGNYEKVYDLLKDLRFASLDTIYQELSDTDKTANKAGTGMLLKRGEGYYDAVKDIIRFRRLCSEPIPEELYKTTTIEKQVQLLLEKGAANFTLIFNDDNEFIFKNDYDMPNPKYKNYSFRGTPDYDRQYDSTNTEVVIDQDGQITKVKCECREFKKGSRNISQPCSHILALYIHSSKFLKLQPTKNKEYKTNDIMEMLL